MLCLTSFFFFFFNDTATTEIYTLSLHDALPISRGQPRGNLPAQMEGIRTRIVEEDLFSRRGAATAVSSSPALDRKSTRLNSSHLVISYAVFCLKKKKKKILHVSVQSIYTVTIYH